MRIPALEFTEKDLNAYMLAPEGSRKACEALLGAARKAAEDFVTGAATDRECAVGQGMLRVAQQLHETLLGAPARHAELATRKPDHGTSSGMEGFM